MSNSNKPIRENKKREIPLWGSFLKTEHTFSSEKSLGLTGIFLKMGLYRDTTSFIPCMGIGRFIDATKSPLFPDGEICYRRRNQPFKKTGYPGEIDKLTDNKIITVYPESPEERKVESIHESKDSEMADFSRDIDESKNIQEDVPERITHSKAAPSSELKRAGDKPNDVKGERENRIQKGIIINYRAKMKRAEGKTIVEEKGKDDSTYEGRVAEEETHPNKVAPIHLSYVKKESNAKVVPMKKTQAGLTGGKENHQKEALTFKSRGDVYSGYDLPLPYKDIASWIKEAKAILEQITELLPLLTKRAKDVESKQSFQMIKKTQQEKKMQSSPMGKGCDDYLLRSYQGNYYLGI